MQTSDFLSRSAKLAGAVAAVLAAIAGCTESSDLTAPEIELVNVRHSPQGDVAPFPSPAQFECIKANVRVDAQGKRLGWDVRSRRADVNRRTDATTADLAVYGMWVFNGLGELVTEAQCVLERSDSSRTTLRRFFDGTSTKRERTAGSSVFANNIGTGTVCEYERIGNSYTGDVICGGTRCSPTWMSLRDGTALRTEGTAPPSRPGYITEAYSCGSLGTLYVDSGGFGIFVPSGGNGGGETGGGACGGGGSGGNPNDTIYDQLRSSLLAQICDTLQAPAPQTTCVPGGIVSGSGWGSVVDTTCYVKLDTTQYRRIDSLLTYMTRPLGQIADSATREACALAAWAARQFLEGNRIFQGAYNTPSNDSLAHMGLNIPQTWSFHIEPYVFADAALSTAPEAMFHYKGELLLTVLHESIHLARNVDHPYIPRGQPQHYTTEPFSHLNDSKSPNPSQCVKW